MIQARKTPTTDACGKMRFARARSARAAAEAKGERHGVRFKVYRCRRCLGYHLTTASD